MVYAVYYCHRLTKTRYYDKFEPTQSNATLESVEKIASALDLPLSKLFELVGDDTFDSIPMKCYELIASKSKEEQEKLYNIIVEIDAYKHQ